MEYDYVLTQLDEHNEVGVMLCKKYKVKVLLVLVQWNDIIKFNILKDAYKELLPDCTVKDIIYEVGDYDSLISILNDYDKSKILVNLTGGDRISSLFLFNEVSKRKIKSIYVDLINKKNYIFSDNIKIISEPFEDLSIDNITKLAGTNIISDSNYLFSKKDVMILTEKIYSNLEIWEKYKKKLYDSRIFVHDYKDSSKVVVKLGELDKSDIIILNNIVKFISELGSINYKKNNDELLIKFNNNYLKGFIFKSGTWLEVLTNKTIKEIKDIDEVRSGVEFFWNNNSKLVKNELDVIAVKDSVLVCISCKDSDKYDEEALNELEIYSNKIGGKDVIKILVATKEPIKKTVIERANEMNINLVILSKDLNQFRNKLINITKGIKK